jgi:hypothetical protein
MGWENFQRTLYLDPSVPDQKEILDYLYRYEPHKVAWQNKVRELIRLGIRAEQQGSSFSVMSEQSFIGSPSFESADEPDDGDPMTNMWSSFQ